MCIFSGQQAFKYKLVDELGSLPDAILGAGQLGQISGQPKTIQIKQKTSFLEQLLDIRSWLSQAESTLLPSTSFRYEAYLPLSAP